MMKEMTEILDNLNKYVPINQATEIIDIDRRSFNVDIDRRSFNVDIDRRSFNVDKSAISRRLLFSDQLTVACVHGANILCSTHLTADQTLQGFLPVVADWHARLCLFIVSIKYVCILDDCYFALGYL